MKEIYALSYLIFCFGFFNSKFLKENEKKFEDCTQIIFNNGTLSANCFGKNSTLSLDDCLTNKNGLIVKGKNFLKECFCEKEILNDKHLECNCQRGIFPRNLVENDIDLKKIIRIKKGKIIC